MLLMNRMDYGHTGHTDDWKIGRLIPMFQAVGEVRSSRGAVLISQTEKYGICGRNRLGTEIRMFS